VITLCVCVCNFVLIYHKQIQTAFLSLRFLNVGYIIKEVKDTFLLYLVSILNKYVMKVLNISFH